MSARALTLAAVAAFSLAACSEAEQREVGAETAAAGESAEATAAEVGDAAVVAGDALAEEAAQVGSAVKSGVSDAAKEIDATTDRWAAEADAREARREANTPNP